MHADRRWCERSSHSFDTKTFEDKRRIQLRRQRHHTTIIHLNHTRMIDTIWRLVVKTRSHRHQRMRRIEWTIAQMVASTLNAFNGMRFDDIDYKCVQSDFPTVGTIYFLLTYFDGFAVKFMIFENSSRWFPFRRFQTGGLISCKHF